ncbi:MAG: fibronectin type III domain-containing protein [bacterium]
MELTIECMDYIVKNGYIESSPGCEYPHFVYLECPNYYGDAVDVAMPILHGVMYMRKISGEQCWWDTVKRYYDHWAEDPSLVGGGWIWNLQHFIALKHEYDALGISNVEVSDITDTSATIRWDTGEPDTSQVEYGTSTSHGEIINPKITPIDPNPVTHHEVRLNGLSKYTKYYFKVRSGDKMSWLYTFIAETPDTTPPPPIVLTIGTITPTFITLNWTAPEDDGAVTVVEAYDLRWATHTITEQNWDKAIQCEFEPHPATPGSIQQYIMHMKDGLLQETLYYFAIKSKDDAGNWSALSNVATATLVDITPPAVPTDLTAIPGNERVSLSWSQNQEVDLAGYRVYRGLNPVVVYTDCFDTDTTSEYTMYGRASYSYSESENWVDFGCYYSGITLVKRLEDRLTQGGFEFKFYPISLRHEADARYAGGVEIGIRSDDEKNGYYFLFPAEVRKTIIKKVVDEEIVAELTQSGDHYPINEQWHTIRIEFSPGTVTGYFNRERILSINDPEAIPTSVDTIYIWLSRQEGYLDDIVVDRRHECWIKDVGTATAFQDTGLINGTTYHYAITAYDTSQNESPYSNEITATPGTDTISPAAITDFAVAAITSNSITLKWTAPGDDGYEGRATTYDIRWATYTITKDNWGSITTGTKILVTQPAYGTETFTVTGLQPNTTYWFAIKTADEVPNWSNLSNVATATPSSPKITLTKKASEQKVYSKGTITYMITYKNEGQATAMNVVIIDVLPKNTVLESEVESQGSEVRYWYGGKWHSEFSSKATKVKWIFKDPIPPGEVGTVSFTVRVE